MRVEENINQAAILGMRDDSSVMKRKRKNDDRSKPQRKGKNKPPQQVGDERLGRS